MIKQEKTYHQPRIQLAIGSLKRRAQSGEHNGGKPLYCQEMNHQTKKNIRVLAEKYHYAIQYDKEVVRLEGDLSRIEVEPTNKGVLTVKYNVTKRTKSLEIADDEICDVLIELFRRKEADVIHRKEGN